jgi:hypothetical protein
MITKSRTSFLEPDGLLIHPNQWESIELYRSTTGEFQVDPFKAGPRTLWGLPRAGGPLLRPGSRGS